MANYTLHHLNWPRCFSASPTTDGYTQGRHKREQWARAYAHSCTDAHLLPQFLSNKPPVVYPQSVPLRVANYCLLGVGLFLLGFSRNPIFHALGGGLSALAGLSLRRAYKIAKARRLELYGEEINRRMQSAPATSTQDQKP